MDQDLIMKKRAFAGTLDSIRVKLKLVDSSNEAEELLHELRAIDLLWYKMMASRH